MRAVQFGGRPRRSVWIAIGVGATLAAFIAITLTMTSARRNSPPASTSHSSSPQAAGVSPHVSAPASTQRIDAPALATLPSTEQPAVYAAAVASHLFDISPANVSRSEFLRYWWANLPTVVYSDGASRGLTLAVQNADAISNLTHGWIPSQATWNAEASQGTVSQLRITSISVPAYWINAVASGKFTDPGLHMERVTGVLSQSYGVGRRYRTTRPIVIDLGLRCGPTQPGGCRLLAPQQPPGQTTNQ
jgi:hypothetical protein